MTFFFTYIFIVLVFWRPQEWLLRALYGWPMLDVVFFMALLMLLIEIDGGKIRFPREFPHPYMIAGLWGAALMSHLAHTYLQGLMDTVVPVFKLCFFTLLLFCVLDRPSRLRAVAAMFVTMACVMSVHALLQQSRGYGFAGLRPSPYQDYVRTQFFGIFEDPNDMAQILATSIPFAFVLTRRQHPVGLLLGGLITWLLVEGILSTHSRGGMVALMTVSALMVAYLLPVRWMPTLLVTGGLAALLLCPLAAPFLEESAHDRVAFWGVANWAFKETPVFGIGFGMMAEYIPEDRAVHNAFVLCYTELGVFGYWFWFGLLELCVIGAWRAREAFAGASDPDERWLARFAGLSIAAIGGFASSGYFLTRAYVYPLFFLFALVGAIPVVAKAYLPEDHPPLLQTRRDVFGLCTAGSLVSIVYIYFSIILLNKAFFGF